MIQIPNDFDTARAYDGSAFPVLPVGGHICRIKGARTEKNRNGGDMLVVDFDISEDGDYDGYYGKRAERATKYSNNRWPGVFRANVLNRDGACGSYFKGFITAVEQSNTGYNFRATGGNEAALRGLYVGLVFGEREFRTSDTGEIKTTVEPFYAVPVAKVREGCPIPARKTLREGAPAGQFAEVDPGEDLPF